jgi:Phage tail assembly chaperone proteins, E, or 41 or 14
MTARDNGLSKPIENYPHVKPEDMPTPPPIDPPGSAFVAPAKATPVEVAVLEFIDPTKLTRTITLDHPFRHEGVEINTVTVRALSVAEVGRVTTEASGDTDLYRYFAAMTNLPAAVLRAMPADDGGRVLEACDFFMPRFMKDSG